jgi:hypothetical protein
MRVSIGSHVGMTENGIHYFVLNPTIYGFSQWLITEAKRCAKKWVEMANYGCMHCTAVRYQKQMKQSEIQAAPPENDGLDLLGITVEEAAKKEISEKILAEMEMLNFNGLRSHLTSKLVSSFSFLKIFTSS